MRDQLAGAEWGWGKVFGNTDCKINYRLKPKLCKQSKNKVKQKNLYRINAIKYNYVYYMRFNIMCKTNKPKVNEYNIFTHLQKIL